MSAFKAYNIEYDSSESEADDTKELQIEDALKLYQSAIKYQSEGPPSFKKAAAAYKELFASEIFRYPESLSELKRSEAFPEYDELLQENFVPVQQPLVIATDNAPNTLPQIIHLSYKNHGLFAFEVLKHRLSSNTPSDEDLQEYIADSATEPLGEFADALDKDDTDLDLWRHSACVAILAGSYRIAKYCLESVLDGDSARQEGIYDSLGIDETLAAHQLHSLLEHLQDDLALISSSLRPARKKALMSALKMLMDPYPSISKPSFNSIAYSILGTAGEDPDVTKIDLVKDYSWSAVGKAIMDHFRAEQGLGGKSKSPKDFGPGSSLRFKKPSVNSSSEDSIDVMAIESPVEPKIAQLPDNRNGQDLNVLDEESGNTTEEKQFEFNSEDQALSKSADPEAPKDASGGELEDAEEQQLSQLSRKRSTESAGLPEVAEGGRVRSKRIRARETLHGSTIDVVGIESTKQQEAASVEQAQRFQEVDQLLFDTIDHFLEKLKANKLVPPEILRNLVKDGSVENSFNENIPNWTALQDMFRMLKNCDSSTYDVLSNWTVSKISIVSRQSGLNAFLGHESGNSLRVSEKPPLPPSYLLGSWIDRLNSQWTPIPEAVCLFISAFTTPPDMSLNFEESSTLYLSYTWPHELRTEIWNILVVFDDIIFDRAQEELHRVEDNNLKVFSASEKKNRNRNVEAHVEMIETLFEIHVDIHSWMISSGNRVEPNQQRLHWERTSRWALLANSAIRLGSRLWSNTRMHDLEIRHIWTHVTHIGIDQSVSQPHKIACTKELKDLMESEEVGERRIQLPNNMIMPDLSLATVVTRLQRMNMKGFFLKVLGEDEKDLVAIIECLEPLLEKTLNGTFENGENAIISSFAPTLSSPTDIDSKSVDDLSMSTDQLLEMGKLIASGGLTLKLPLWRRLREAYESISYPPKVVSCDLRTIELLVRELASETFMETDKSQRINILPQWLVLIDDCVSRVLSRRDTENFLELVDEHHLASTMSALAQYCNLLHVARLFEDTIQTGQISPPSIEGRGQRYATVANKLNDMELRAWVLQYVLFKDGVQQLSEEFPNANDDRLNFLRAVHYALGARGECKASQKLFLKLSKEELLELPSSEERRFELCQVLYDLHGLQCFRHTWDMLDHGLPDNEQLTRKSATRLLPFLIAQTKEFTKRDPPKAELKATLEKVHSALGRPKPMESTSMNRRICVAYIKGPVNPLNIASCARGMFSLNTRSITPSSSPIAATGWYFLMGNLALQKYKSQKRLHQTNTEDLDTAAIQFLLDLEYSSEHWETWYRLGQVYDSQIEEAVTWTAEKVNSMSNDLVNLQRAAINSYAMAIACINRHDIEESEDTASVIGELYADFGNRLYSSSRDPFSMRAFAIRDNEEKHFNRNDPGEQFMYKRPPFTSFQNHTVWKLAAHLFRDAVKRKGDNWYNHYMLGKCLWKLYSIEDESLLKGDKPSSESLLKCFARAVEELPNRDSRKDPILEPHYKQVSIVHKLVSKGVVTPSAASEILALSCYAKNLDAPNDLESWETYILSVLKTLRSADKSGWHHRMTARAAHIIYNGTGKGLVGAQGAKQELTQSIFTKAMMVQVWKPEFERPGRHFVYTSRYVKFFFELLDKTNDRASYGLLLRKLRKKPAEYFDHKDLWQEECVKYIKMLRRSGPIPEAQEDTVFKAINHDEFSKHANSLEKWSTVLSPENNTLEILREAVEVKKLNGGYMKSTLIDDLIGDAYAKLYIDITPTLADSGEIPDKIAEAVASDQPLSTAADQPSRTRIKGVGRRELLRRAEAAGSSPAAATPQVLALRQAMASEMDSTTTSPTAGSTRAGIDLPRKRSRSIGGTEREDGGDEKEERPPSIHDSADESELSELDDTAELDEFKEHLVARLLPNSMGSTNRNVESEADSPRTFMGDQPDEEEEGEENEEADEGLDEDEQMDDGDKEAGSENAEDENGVLQQSAEAMDVDTPN